jgi:WhiB family transcriptional regulator, redox-sensing transcriptional regulator
MTVHMNWREDIACRDADPDLFFPIGATGPALRQMEEAKRICRACPVQIQCLAWALENGVADGVWGGTTPDERRIIRSLSRRTTRVRQMAMARVITQQSAENMAYVRRLLGEKQPGFSAALELALMLAELELTSSEMPGQLSASEHS